MRYGAVVALLAVAGLASCAALLPGSDHLTGSDGDDSGVHPSEAGPAPPSDDASDTEASASLDGTADTAAQPTDAGAAPVDAGPCAACDAAQCFEGVCDGNHIVQVTAALALGCALTKAGSVWCWGGNASGELGVAPAATPESCRFSIQSDSIPCHPAPMEVPGLHDVVQISAGTGSVCAVDRDGGVWCWGDDFYSELGHSKALDTVCVDPVYGDHACQPTPTQVEGLVAKSVSQSGWNACAVTTGGNVVCWGDDSRGDLGSGAVGDASTTPQAALGLTNVTKVVTGVPNCALEKDGSIWCWGSGDLALGHAPGTHGDVSSGGTLYTPTPTPVYKQDNTTPAFGPGALVASDVGSTSNAVCAIAGGAVWCWGDDKNGVVGDPANGDHFYPTPLGASAASVGGGAELACLVQPDGGSECWGQGPWGELANGVVMMDASTGNCSVHVPCAMPTEIVEPGPWSQVAPAFGHVVARKVDGTVWAWGINDVGRLGHEPGDGGDLQCDQTALFHQSYPCSPKPLQVTGLP